MKVFSLVAVLAVLLSYMGVRAAHLSPALTVASSAAAATDECSRPQMRTVPKPM